MRSFARPLVAAGVALALYLPAVAQTIGPRGLYDQVLVQERALRRDIAGHKAGSPALPLLRRARILIGTYEDIARLYPASESSGQALWQGAALAAYTFWEFGETAEKATALRLFNTLSTRRLSGTMGAQIADQTRRLGAAVPSPSSPPDVAAPPATTPSSIATSVKAAPVPRPDALRPPASQAAPRTAPAPPPTDAPAARTSTTGPSMMRVASPSASVSATLKTIRREVLPAALRVTLELERETFFQEQRLENPSRLVVDLQNTGIVDALKAAPLAYRDDVVREISVERQPDMGARVVLNLAGAGRYSVYPLYDPYRLVLDFERAETPPATRLASSEGAASVARSPGGRDSATPAPSAITPAASTDLVSRRLPVSIFAGPAAAPGVVSAPDGTLTNLSAAPGSPNPNSKGGFSLSRQLGLGVGRIVIDPGHGGHDPGAQAEGLSEADLVLDIALRLEKLLLKVPGVEVIMSRRSDVFVPLEERTAIANRAGADLFLSIHANASADGRARGIETYFLNFAPNPQAEALAARENAGSARTMRSLPDIVKAIALNNKIDESRDFASLVQTSMVERLRRANKDTRNLGVKQAPFMVLIGATMPSVLAEISFITNNQEAALLKTPAYRQQMADALMTGVMRYQKSLKVNQLATR